MVSDILKLPVLICYRLGNSTNYVQSWLTKYKLDSLVVGGPQIILAGGRFVDPATLILSETSIGIVKA